MAIYNERGEAIDYTEKPRTKEEDRAYYVGAFRAIYDDAESLARDAGVPVEFGFQYVLWNAWMSTTSAWLRQHREFVSQNTRGVLDAIRDELGEGWR